MVRSREDTRLPQKPFFPLSILFFFFFFLHQHSRSRWKCCRTFVVPPAWLVKDCVDTWMVHHLPSERFTNTERSLVCGVKYAWGLDRLHPLGVEEWLCFRTREQQFQGKKAAMTNNKTQPQYTAYWLGRPAVRASTQSCYEIIGPRVWSTKNL